MKFLLFLIAIVIIVKCSRAFHIEGFDGNCIRPFYPNFSNSSLNYPILKELYMKKNDISEELKEYELNDLSASIIIEDISGFMKDPLGPDYPYYNPICTLSYIDYN